jgi:hypothetical protein
MGDFGESEGDRVAICKRGAHRKTRCSARHDPNGEQLHHSTDMSQIMMITLQQRSVSAKMQRTTRKPPSAEIRKSYFAQ